MHEKQVAPLMQIYIMALISNEALALEHGLNQTPAPLSVTL